MNSSIYLIKKENSVLKRIYIYMDFKKYNLGRDKYEFKENY